MAKLVFNPITGKMDKVALTAQEAEDIRTGASWTLPGPYTNESAAATAGIQIGQAYYDNGGTVRVRLT